MPGKQPHEESWAKVTVVLLDRHVAYLDRLAIDIRLKHHVAISRAELIRGLIEAAFQSGRDLSDGKSVDDIVRILNSPPKNVAPKISPPPVRKGR